MLHGPHNITDYELDDAHARHIVSLFDCSAHDALITSCNVSLSDLIDGMQLGNQKTVGHVYFPDATTLPAFRSGNPKEGEANRAWSCHAVNHQGWLDAHLNRHNIALYLDDSRRGQGSQSYEGQDRTLKMAMISLSSWGCNLAQSVKYARQVCAILWCRFEA